MSLYSLLEKRASLKIRKPALIVRLDPYHREQISKENH